MATVLIADDASFMRSSLKFIFEEAGHQVLGMAEDGAEALVLFDELHPDVVTLDLLMPEMEGIEVLRKIREKNKDVVVIMVTAVGHEKKRREARILGAAGYITKPFKHDDVRNVIDDAIGSKSGA